MRGVINKKLKKVAISLRRQGYSYPIIERKIGVARATLSGWFRGLQLSSVAEKLILKRKIRNIKIARTKALELLLKKRNAEIAEMQTAIRSEFENQVLDTAKKELLLAMLYLGEGFKKKSQVGLGNSNPEIALLFVKLLREVYNVSDSKLRCYLYLRMDQKAEVEKKFWSNYLGIPLEYFRKPQFDKRTANFKTWKSYHGVCAIYCYDAKIEKRLTIVQRILIEKIMGL